MFNDTLKSLLMTYYNFNVIGSQTFTIIGSSASYLSESIRSSLVLVCKCVLSFKQFQFSNEQARRDTRNFFLDVRLNMISILCKFHKIRAVKLSVSQEYHFV